MSSNGDFAKGAADRFVAFILSSIVALVVSFVVMVPLAYFISIEVGLIAGAVLLLVVSVSVYFALIQSK